MIENINNFSEYSPFYLDLKVLFETKTNFSNKDEVRFEVSFHWRRAKQWNFDISTFSHFQPAAWSDDILHTYTLIMSVLMIEIFSSEEF